MFGFLKRQPKTASPESSSSSSPDKLNTAEECKDTKGITYDEVVKDLENSFFTNHPALKSRLSSILYDYLATHRIEEAYDNLQKLHQELAEANIEFDEIKANVSENLRCFLKNIPREYEIMTSFLNNLADNEGWSVESSSPEYTVKYRYQSEYGSLAFKMEGVIDCPIIGTIAVLNELDLFVNWVPYLKVANEMKVIHQASRVAFCSLALPPPLNNREYHLIGNGYDRSHKNGSVVIVSRGIDEDPEFLQNNNLELQYTSKKSVVNRIRIAAFELKPAPGDKTSIRCLINMDPQMNFIPKPMRNYFFKLGAGQTFSSIKKTAEAYKGSEYERRVNSIDYDSKYAWIRRGLTNMVLPGPTVEVVATIEEQNNEAASQNHTNDSENNNEDSRMTEEQAPLEESLDQESDIISTKNPDQSNE